MIKPVNGKILVSVDMKQKDTQMIGGIKVKTALAFEVNYREKSPVIAKVEQGNGYITKGSFLICHHNHYYPPSPYHLYDNLYSIPANHTIFAVLREDGSLKAVYGNVLGERVTIPTLLPVGPDKEEKYKDRIMVTDPGDTKYKKGQLIFTRFSAPYDIVYNWGDEVKRITKVTSTMIVGVLK